MNLDSPQAHARDFIEALAARGQHHFTTGAAREALGVSEDAVKLALNRLRKQGLIARPSRGFYVIIPPEYKTLGCLPADQFVPALMAHVGQRYYAGLLSAAQYYGAAHHRPQQYQVMVEKPRRAIKCGRVQVGFHVRKQLADIPVRSFNTPRGTVKVSTPEATAFDLVGYVKQSGGFDQITTVLAELAEEIDPDALRALAPQIPISWVQRLGYLLELAEAPDTADALADYVAENASDFVALRSDGPETGARHGPWKLLINTTVEPEL